MISLKVNGVERQIDADPDMPLLWALRDLLKLTGTKYGCGIAQCGACTVHLDGQPMRSCVTPVSAVGSAEIRTVEGLSGEAATHPVQQAWIELDVVQCGYCQSPGHGGCRADRAEPLADRRRHRRRDERQHLSLRNLSANPRRREARCRNQARR